MAVSTLVRWYLLVCGLFELIPLSKMWIMEYPPHSALPFTAAHNSNEDLKRTLSLLLAVLVVVRVGGFLAGGALTKVHKWAIVLLHATEVVFILPMYMDNVVPRRALMPQEKRWEADFIMAIICLNPVIFTFLRAATMVRRKQG